MIELSKAQVNRVVREAAQDDALLGLLGAPGEVDFQASPEQLDDPRLSRSLLRALMILASFPADGTARALTDVANQLGMAASTAHRYLSTFVEVGLLERDPDSRAYRRAGKG